MGRGGKGWDEDGKGWEGDGRMGGWEGGKEDGRGWVGGGKMGNVRRNCRSLLVPGLGFPECALF